MLVQRACEFVVAARDGLAESEGVFGFEGEAPACLVELVERYCPLGHLNSTASVAGLEAGATGALKQFEQDGA